MTTMIYPSGGELRQHLPKATVFATIFATLETRDMATRPATRCKACDYIHFRLKRVMHIDVLTLGHKASDRKARAAAKAGALARSTTPRALALWPNPSGKQGKGPATSLQAAC
ncbi:hypothetical protein, partial [Acidovorax sp.]|uniref:hypothetical protein n=1 Tax=Acidovorax sp. TaxID=1872122 RepID=UPI00261F1704